LHPSDPLNRARAIAGFTIVELMLVVALIAVLAAIASPAYTSYRDRANTFQAVQDITGMSAKISNRWNDARSYPETLDEIGMGGTLDPWGSPYVYYNVDSNGKGHARKDHALNPINTDFDLYSLGPDKKSKPQITQKDSVDDVIRASNGAFFGKASDF
jgi:general secretion pathway protein G